MKAVSPVALRVFDAACGCLVSRRALSALLIVALLAPVTLSLGLRTAQAQGNGLNDWFGSSSTQATKLSGGNETSGIATPLGNFGGAKTGNSGAPLPFVFPEQAGGSDAAGRNAVAPETENDWNLTGEFAASAFRRFAKNIIGFLPALAFVTGDNRNPSAAATVIDPPANSASENLKNIIAAVPEEPLTSGSTMSGKQTILSAAVTQPAAPGKSAKTATSATAMKSVTPAATAPPVAAPPAMTPQPAAATSFDFDGDGRADLARYKPDAREWRVKPSSGGPTAAAQITAFTGAAANSSVVPADYDGDGKTDLAVFDAATAGWRIKQSSTNSVITFSFGGVGDKPVSADYDADGRADAAVWRASNGTWYIRKSSQNPTASTNVTTAQQWGQAGDIPAVGDFDGNGLADFAIFRAGGNGSQGFWFVLSDAGAITQTQWGQSADIPVAADYDADGKTDYAVWRRDSGTWYALLSSTGGFSSAVWGNYGDQPVPADFDGDSKADFAVWRPATGVWYVIKSSDVSGTPSAYRTEAFGALGDAPAPAAYLKQTGANVAPSILAAARLSPNNAAGNTSLFSRNFWWGTGLVSLPGRAGMDLNVGLSYNSLVWTKVPGAAGVSSDAVYFDADGSNLTPGFRFGFPVIEESYRDGLTGNFNYMMVGPSGERTVLRQTAASGVYEATDSSYLQLQVTSKFGANDAEEIEPVLVTTSGTRMTFEWRGGAYRCREIKDSNGNFITVNHDQYGVLQSITDTLGRVVTFNYFAPNTPDAGLLQSVTQTWQSGVHTWATFAYETKQIYPNFESGIAVIGPANDTALRLLDRVTLADGSSSRFDYNRFGQVYRVSQYAADNHRLNYTAINAAINLDNNSPAQAAQADCPRFSETRTWAENFIANGMNSQNETVTANLFEEHQTITGIGEPLTRVTFTAPDGVVSKSYSLEREPFVALPFISETWAAASATDPTPEKKRWVNTDWTTDDNTLAYKINPRQTAVKVSDATSSRQTVMEYYLKSGSTTATEFGLVKKASEYDIYGGNALLRSTRMDYNRDSNLLAKRIIGLPVKQELLDANDALVSKAVFGYDEYPDGFTGAEQNISPVQHDHTKYGANFSTRGNPTSTTKCDVSLSSETTCGGGITSSVRYNTAGAAVAQISPGSEAGTTRTTSISYADSFYGTQPPVGATFAYPTKLTDAAGNFSRVKYRFDIGANVRAQSPAPAGQSTGKVSARSFDDFGRLVRESILKPNNQEHSYTRYEYSLDHRQASTHTTLIDTNGNGAADGADEALSITYFDGAGRTRGTIADHPGSTGHYVGQFVEYDLMGRVWHKSVPTEVDGGFAPAGDDEARGWLQTTQEYDWKGRPTKTVNTDGTFSDITYEGCGCAGGEIVTIQGEQVAEGRKTQRIHSDIFGRQFKTEVMNWDGTVYATTITKFNGRDQAVWMKQFVGQAPADALNNDSCPTQPTNEAQSCQISKMTYDGYGRLKTQHAPQQDNGTATAFEYYQTGQVKIKTDARGATETYTYDNRGLVESIVSTMPPPQNSSNSLTPDCDGADECDLQCPNRPDYCDIDPTHPPIGFLDTIETTEWKAKGWSFDPDNSSASNTIHFYLDGPAGSGTFIGSAVADQSRPDVNTAHNVAGNHGYEFTIPNQYLDGSPHRLFAYGLDVTGDNAPTLLNGSPKYFSSSPTTMTSPLNSSVTFEYDALGNRIKMIDLLGKTDYSYDELSRLTSETRQFTGTTPNGQPLVMSEAPLPNNSFKLQYSYNLSGNLASLTDPFGAIIDYAYDQTGRLKTVTGSAFGGVTSYVSNAQYQAWGALKQLDYGNGLQMSMTFNNNLQPATYNLAGAGRQVMQKTYDYNADGSLRYAQDLLDPKFDRLNSYDHLGRINEGRSGAEARGGTVTPQDRAAQLPYRQSYRYDAFGNMTGRDNLHWGIDTWYGENFNQSQTFRNNRASNITYDADGRALRNTDYTESTYNAAGMIARLTTPEETDISRFYDGNGRESKRRTWRWSAPDPNQGGTWVADFDKYFIRSSVLGNEVVSDVLSNGRKNKSYVYAAGARIAWQSAYYAENSPLSEAVFYEYSDSAGLSSRTADKTGQAAVTGDGGDGSAAEVDPLGNNVGLSTPYFEPIIYTPDPSYPVLQPYGSEAPLYINGVRARFAIDGLVVDQMFFMSVFESTFHSPMEYIESQATRSVPRLTNYQVGGRTFAPTERGFTNAYAWASETHSSTIFANHSYDWGNIGSIIGTLSNPAQQQRSPEIVNPKGTAYLNLPNDLLERLKKRLANPDCANAIKAFQDRLAQNTGEDAFSFDIEALYNRIKSIKLDPKLNPLTGRARDGRKVAIGPVAANPPNLEHSLEAYVSVLLHEIAHHSAKNGVYDDRAFALAARDLLKESGLNPPSVPSNKNDIEANGRYAQTNYFNKYCPSPTGQK